jgi:hypothetical protein
MAPVLIFLWNVGIQTLPIEFIYKSKWGASPLIPDFNCLKDKYLCLRGDKHCMEGKEVSI